MVVTHQKTPTVPLSYTNVADRKPDAERTYITHNFVHEEEGPGGLPGSTAEALQTACFIRLSSHTGLQLWGT